MERKDLSGKVEWRVNLPNGRSEVLVPESSSHLQRVACGLQGFIIGFAMKLWRFLEKAWNLGVSEPKKVIHCVKVGLALSFVSVFYYTRPLYDSFGGNAMWAVMTVIVVFEYTVGATLAKCINRTIGTFLAGSLGIGVHWVANHSGEKLEPIILGTSVFFLAAAATFSRFIPSIKARFDYGAMIFILTFSLVSVSGYRVEKLVEMAHQRLSTIAIGTSICLVTTMIVSPVWAGCELHLLITKNLEKLSDSLDGVAVYFKDDGNVNSAKEASIKKLQGYKCVLNSKATEDAMANFARWEPAHGPFHFRHPWKQCLKVGTSMRNCAYYIEALNGCINSEIEPPEFLRNHFSDICQTLSSRSRDVLKELAIMMKTMKKSTKIDLKVVEMNFAVQDLQNAMKTLPSPPVQPTSQEAEAQENREEEPNTRPYIVPLVDIIPLLTTVSLLIDIATRIEAIVNEVNEVAEQAEFKTENDKKSKQDQDGIDMKTLQRV